MYLLRLMMVVVVVGVIVAEETTIYNATISTMDTTTDHPFTMQEGCTAADGIGSVIVECSISGTRFSYEVDMAVTWINVIYETKSRMICADMFQAKRLVDSYISTDGQTDVRLNFIKIDSAILSNESLACPLALLGANKTNILRLQRCRGELLPHHLEGIQGVQKFQMLDIEKNITSVPYSALSRLTSLEKATFAGGSFVLKEEGAGTLLPKLITLELSQGGLKTLPKRAFKNTPELTLLLLYSNQIEYVDEDAFEGLTKLEQLSMGGNRISTLPVGVFRFTPNLVNIDLYNNLFTNLTDGVFTGLTRLTKVSLFTNLANLTFSGGVFGHLPSLTHLRLDTASITSLPPDFIMNTPNLQTFIMKNNLLGTLSPHLFSVSAPNGSISLIFIDLSSNRLVTIHKEQFANLKSLKTLYLDDNLVTDLSVGVFSDLAKLEVLMLRNNRIEVLNKGIFKGLNNLIQLNLDGNRIKVIQNGVFDVVTTLQTLSLCDNNMTISKTANTERVTEFVSYESGHALADDSLVMYYSRFRTLKALTSLRLAGNRVRIVCRDWQEMYQLRRLNLSRNNFTRLVAQDSDFFANTTVDFSDNKIETIDVYAYNVVPVEQRPELVLHGNPFRCTCDLFPLLSSPSSPRLVLNNASCESPPALKNTALAALNLDSLTCDIPCSPPCGACRRRPAARLLEVECDTPPYELPAPPSGLRYSLRVTNPAALRLNLPALAHATVDLSNLNLTEPPQAPEFSLQHNLTIDLRYNKLGAVPAALLEAGAALYLANNSFQCTCSQQAGLKIVARYLSNVRDAGLVRCADGSALTVRVREAGTGELCWQRDVKVLASAVLVVACLVVALAAWLYKRRTRVLVLCHKYLPRRVLAELHAGASTDVDVFLSYAPSDEQFARAALTALEARGLRLCVQSRDWWPGDSIAEQVQRSVRSAALTVAVLSPAYLKCAWRAQEYRLAHARARLLVLVVDDAVLNDADLNSHSVLREHVRANACVRVTHPRVWDKVHEAVLKRRILSPPVINGDKPRGLHAQLTDDGKILNAALTRV